MRVFELARELNIPGKDLIVRMQGFGYKVDGNFHVLDNKTIEEVKSKMLQPVSRVEEDASSVGVGGAEAEEAPRKRRIISASRSGQVRKIKESLGIEGPLPEDQQTREEVQPATHQEAAEPVAEGAAPQEGDVAAAVAADAQGEASAEVSGEASEVTAQAGSVEPQAPVRGRLTPPPPIDETAIHRPRAPRPVQGIPLPKPVDVSAVGQPVPRRMEEDRDGRGSARKGVRGAEEPARPGQWRDVKRDRNKPPGVGGDDEWVKPRRPRGDKRRAGGRVARSSDEPRHTFNPRKNAVRIGDSIRVGELAGAIGIKASHIIRKLVQIGVIATVNDVIEGSTAELIAAEYNVEVEMVASTAEDVLIEMDIAEEDLHPRPPIITIMGHVDHGKTTLLDHIRSSQITSGEAGGITQHIGAYYVAAPTGDMVFLDTPGHEAFTTLRQRGADVTDIVVLIVAADDGIMPQTVEAIEHAKAAKVPILVAINKVDRPNADPDRIKTQLMEHGLVAEDFGGETVVVQVSALTGQGVEHLLEMIHLQAEMLEMRSTGNGPARGHVIETQMDRRRGPLGTVLVSRGTLRVGDHFVVGQSYGRVRAMNDDRGRTLLAATPSMPVEILGYSELPEAGDLLVVVPDEKSAREAAAARSQQKKEVDSAERRRVSLEDFLSEAPAQEVARSLNLVLKTDAQGSLEAIRGALEREGNSSIRVAIIRAGVGGITETDVSLAATANAVVIGFNVRGEAKATELARAEGVDVKTYTIIYELIDDIHSALEGMLKPLVREEMSGQLQVKEIFSNSKEGRIAGGQVSDGSIDRSAMIRVYRDNVIIHTGTLNSLRRFKDDVSTVQSGQECGFRVTNFHDLQAGDLIEAFVRIEETATLERAGRAS